MWIDSSKDKKSILDDDHAVIPANTGSESLSSETYPCIFI